MIIFTDTCWRNLQSLLGSTGGQPPCSLEGPGEAIATLAKEAICPPLRVRSLRSPLCEGSSKDSGIPGVCCHQALHEN
ncbi:hypothetical protein GEOBRER4_n2565 [Citrifermentans bremense]|uniref:Uncharacterized protein n=1 Tax=Citrifermentans bremense TaxID=60035 RepID=A0A7R7J098_9BACT|nr:hypothetical protein GEOBRER4_n2565 [Citrifermentans bremense]